MNKASFRTRRGKDAASASILPLLALGVLVLVLSGGKASINADTRTPSFESVEADGKKAMARLRAAGIQIYDRRDLGPARVLSISFERWHGDDADLKWLADVTPLGEASAYFDLKHVKPAAVSRVKLRVPLEQLRVELDEDQPVQELTALPACRGLNIYDRRATREDFRHLVRLLPSTGCWEISGHVEPDGSFVTVSDDDLAELAPLKGLKELELGCSAITEAGLSHLSGMKRLERLSLSSCPGLDGAKLGALANLKSLRRLVFGARVSSAGLANICQLTALEELSFVPGPLTAVDVRPLAGLTHLESLFVWHPPSSDQNVPSLQDCRERTELFNAVGLATAAMPNLRALSLDQPLDEAGLAAIVSHDKLEELSLELTEVNDRSLELIGHLSALTQLTLAGESKLSDRGFADLARLAALSELSLPAAGITDAAIPHLAGLTRLESLDLQQCEITGATFAALAPLTRLQSLNLAGSSFSDEGCRLLTQFVNLKTLDLSGAKVTDVGIEALAKIPNLECLIIDGTTVTDRGLAYLAGHMCLSSISAVDTSVAEDAVKQLLSARPKGTPGVMRHLDVHFGNGDIPNFASDYDPDSEAATD